MIVSFSFNKLKHVKQQSMLIIYTSLAQYRGMYHIIMSMNGVGIWRLNFMREGMAPKTIFKIWVYNRNCCRI